MLTTQQIVSIEEQVTQLTDNLKEFCSVLPAGDNPHYGDTYNYLGTLQVNLGSLDRAVQQVRNTIKIKTW